MDSRDRFMWSMSSLLQHVDSGVIQDTALPGTPAAEATRLLKNGLAVSAYACFEHFIRGRIVELLYEVSSSDARPAFENLPDGLQLAATQGVVDAIRFRLQRADDFSTADIVRTVQSHTGAASSATGRDYRFSSWAFGWSSSNISAGTLIEFLRACGAPNFGNEFSNVLRDLRFDYAAAGLTEGEKFKIRNFAAWRHEAAHDATLSIDVQLLKTRVTAYVAIACAFDLLASSAVKHLLEESPGEGERTVPTRTNFELRELVAVEEQHVLHAKPGASEITFYSVAQCKDQLPSRPMPQLGMVVARDKQEQISDWFFF